MNHLTCRIIFCLAVIFSISLPISAQAKLLYIFDFENNDFGNVAKTSQKSNSGYPSLCCPQAAQIVKTPVRNGKYAVKFTLSSDDQGYIYGSWEAPPRRAELERHGIDHVGFTRWYGFSVYIDPSWQIDYQDSVGALLAQWHDGREYPHLSIRVRKDEWVIKNDSDPNPITTETSFTRKEWSAGKIQTGKWMDWVVYAKWSYKSDGILKVWKDGKLVVNHNGPNTYNHESKEFFKFGIYKSKWGSKPPSNRQKFIVYHDEIRIGDENSSYQEVAPKGAQSLRPLDPHPPTDLRVINLHN